MAIAYDAFSSNVSTTATNVSFTHTPVGVPRGVVILVTQDAGSLDTFTMTYGGVDVPFRTSVDGSGNAEPGFVYCFFLGVVTLTGAQTVTSASVDGSVKSFVCYTVTAAADTAVEGENSLVSTSQDDPSFTITTGAGVETMGFAAIFSGLGTIGNVTAGSGWTKDSGKTFTGQVDAVEHLSAVDAGSNITCAFTTTAADDVTMYGVAIKELSTRQLPFVQPSNFQDPAIF